MLTRLRFTNFKRFESADIELGKAVVLIGPNNSGKTTALQALALWNVGIRKWNDRRLGKVSPEKRPGVTINRRDLLAIPVPNANLLWRDLHSRDVKQVWDEAKGKNVPKTENIRVEITVEGVTSGKAWQCGLEFDYANEESIYCRPLRTTNGPKPERMEIPAEVTGIRVAFLPPMSGLAAVEPKWEPGRVNVLIGEGQTAQVLRNLCLQIHTTPDSQKDWNTLTDHIQRLFGVKLLPPRYLAERGEIAMDYEEPNHTRLDLSSSGRGLQQTLLLLAHLYSNPGSVLLLDEPDAHLEILRQRQIYNLITETSQRQGSQIIAASHSEIVLNEAADKDTVIAFVGRPHRIDDRGSQVLKALRDIGFDHYYQAQQTGWILYVEGPSDLMILQTFARLLEHPASTHLERPFVHYVATNVPQRARDHFFGLREAKNDLVGVALFDGLDKGLQQGTPLKELMWARREIENYFCSEEVLLAYAEFNQPSDLFGAAERVRRKTAMQEVIKEVSSALETLGKPDPWSSEIKVTDEFLDPVLRKFFAKLQLPLELRKSEYHVLAALTPKDRIDPEVREKLDAIVEVAKKATPESI